MELSEHLSPRGRISDNRRIKIGTFIIPDSFPRVLPVRVYDIHCVHPREHQPHLSARMFRVLTAPACIFNTKLPPTFAFFQPTLLLARTLHHVVIHFFNAS